MVDVRRREPASVCSGRNGNRESGKFNRQGGRKQSAPVPADAGDRGFILHGDAALRPGERAVSAMSGRWALAPNVWRAEAILDGKVARTDHLAIRAGNRRLISRFAVLIGAAEIPGIDVPGIDVPGIDIPGIRIPGVEIS